MEMSQEKLEKMITKMVGVIKPNGVSFIDFDLEHIGENEYYMSVGYVVPDNSPYLKISTSPRTFNDIRSEWNSSLRQSIKNFFDIKVIINSSGIRSESWFKEYNQ